MVDIWVRTHHDRAWGTRKKRQSVVVIPSLVSTPNTNTLALVNTLVNTLASTRQHTHEHTHTHTSTRTRTHTRPLSLALLDVGFAL